MEDKEIDINIEPAKETIQTIYKLDIDTVSVHEAALVTPMMSKDQFATFVLDIEKHGQKDPVTLYRSKIVDGRHRYMALNKLGVKTINAIKLPNNTTIDEIKTIAKSCETRRHQTASQLAIGAYRAILASKENMTYEEASKEYGINSKRIGEAKKIDVTYGRRDILDLLFNGEKFNTGTAHIPFYTDSLGTILVWLSKNGVIQGAREVEVGIKQRVELMDDEQALVNKYMALLRNENVLIRDAISKALYAESLIK